jgi:sialidase-1
VESVCQASLIRYSWPRGNDKGFLLFSNPAVPKGRDHLTVRASTDDAKTWPTSRLICEGSSAYSSLAVLPRGQIGLLYERDNYKHLTLARFSQDWIMSPKNDRVAAEIRPKNFGMFDFAHPS